MARASSYQVAVLGEPRDLPGRSCAPSRTHPPIPVGAWWNLKEPLALRDVAQILSRELDELALSSAAFALLQYNLVPLHLHPGDPSEHHSNALCRKMRNLEETCFI